MVFNHKLNSHEKPMSHNVLMGTYKDIYYLIFQTNYRLITLRTNLPLSVRIDTKKIPRSGKLIVIIPFIAFLPSIAEQTVFPDISMTSIFIKLPALGCIFQDPSSSVIRKSLPSTTGDKPVISSPVTSSNI